MAADVTRCSLLKKQTSVGWFDTSPTTQARLACTRRLLSRRLFDPITTTPPRNMLVPFMLLIVRAQCKSQELRTYKVKPGYSPSVFAPKAVCHLGGLSPPKTKQHKRTLIPALYFETGIRTQARFDLLIRERPCYAPPDFLLLCNFSVFTAPGFILFPGDVGRKRGPLSHGRAGTINSCETEQYAHSSGGVSVTLLGLRSCLEDKRRKTRVLRPPNGTAVLKGLTALGFLVSRKAKADRGAFLYERAGNVRRTGGDTVLPLPNQKTVRTQPLSATGFFFCWSEPTHRIIQHGFRMQQHLPGTVM